MKGLLLIVTLFVISSTNHVLGNEKKIVCYFGSWAVYRYGNGRFEIPLMDPFLCTHMIYTFAGLGYDGTIKSLDPYADLPDNYGLNGFGKINRLRDMNPNLKTIIAMGGWNEGSIKYSAAVKTAPQRTKLADSIVEFVKKYNFDGFDLDWEYPNQRGGSYEDKENYILLLKELKQKLSNVGKLFTVAVGASETSAQLSYNIPELVKHVDFINLMTYDYHGASWENVLGIVAPLYASPKEKEYRSILNVNASVSYWLHKGVPPEKLIMGVPFYGQSFRMADRTKTTPGSPSAGPGNAGPYTQQSGTLSYLELCELFRREDYTHEFEKYQRVPYSYKGDQWVGYDNIDSLEEKAKYILKMGLGGVMIWSIESDDFRGVCGDSFPLLKTLNHVLRGGEKPATKPPTEFTTQDPATIHSTTKSTNGGGNGNEENSDICVKEGFVRDPQDCTKFYYCQDIGGSFKAYEYHCPAGLFFNTITNNCDYPENVECVMRYPRSFSPLDFTCNKNGFYRDPVDCAKFYLCQEYVDGFKVFEYNCPKGLHFNTKTNKCDYPENVNCKKQLYKQNNFI